ncbi:MAG: LysR family transcriptional regulator [Acidaminococcaceae bacterium]|nr:LysR family transcriptional regulator [Acidaminococcaceae bacterium]
MDIRTLQYFLAVACEESISGAAKFLHMTQPPLSRQLKELETELGKQLFIRGNRKITLTEDGMILRKRAEEIVSLMEKQKPSSLPPAKISAATFILVVLKQKAFGQ